ncbi:uncharacterized protein KQ657_001455 [Scheffersomyces spartinae]|uniref:Phosphomethylpyrimidine kinase n=1 Tax=Scheffersomyces spartinae TaxID=45513 RepID=A0A9P8AI14_9ASCO|nr:uncharacterized protein KQ657_001455 [Scheffersomyces spartinae]KAG7192674.1 hypothetical protein KQ657_001455 [Scheffersomyces spartinae]
MTATIRRKLRHDINPNKAMLPAVLTVAGSDCSGGAGIEADLKTLAAHKVYGLTCITALTAQNTTGVGSFIETPRDHLFKMFEMNFEDFVEGYESPPLKVLKTGMLTEAGVAVVTEKISVLKSKGIKLVVDPVMVSTSGCKLSEDKTIVNCIRELLPESDLVTPNYKEAVKLLRIVSELGKKEETFIEPKITLVDDFVQFVIQLQRQLKCKNLLVKGGHIPWDTIADCPYSGPAEDIPESRTDTISMLDILYESESDTVTVYESRYINTKDSHGTGCTLASAIAANLALGNTIPDSVGCAVDYVHQGMNSIRPHLGHGNGPINHNVTPETVSPEKVVNNEVTPETALNPPVTGPSVLDYFINHPKVAAIWKQYTNHRFLHQLARNQLDYNRFIYFLKQDYHYLINYAQVHAHAAAVAPTYEQTHAHALIIGDIVQEIERHKEKLCHKYDIVYERDMDLDIELKKGKACEAYCNYLLDIAGTGDFVAIKVALAPCLHGYRYGGEYAKHIRNGVKSTTNDEWKVTELEAKVYGDWIDDYNSEWYHKAHLEGMKSLDVLVSASETSEARLEYLAGIFSDVSLLEVAFWDEVIKE